MQRHRTARPRIVVSILTFVFAAPLALTGCGSGSGSNNPVDQATAGREAAKSSMDYMRKQIAERKGAPKVKTGIR